MVSTTSLKSLFFYFFFLTFLIAKVYPDECSIELPACEFCICDCETTSTRGREWCGAECAATCISCPECIG
ncbi:hypothetical protein C1646_691766 [Rhizophagus diaphanus]|nr:hypothetical protein C1646_691766 [Rhizophagus diaphanus] [Rhizophagus sp. MUCL 43196]